MQWLIGVVGNVKIVDMFYAMPLYSALYYTSYIFIYMNVKRMSQWGSHSIFRWMVMYTTGDMAMVMYVRGISLEWFDMVWHGIEWWHGVRPTLCCVVYKPNIYNNINSTKRYPLASYSLSPCITYVQIDIYIYMHDDDGYIPYMFLCYIYTYVFMYYWIACYFIFFIWECRISIYPYIIQHIWWIITQLYDPTINSTAATITARPNRAK